MILEGNTDAMRELGLIADGNEIKVETGETVFTATEATADFYK
jgi:hypothetical protein